MSRENMPSRSGNRVGVREVSEGSVQVRCAGERVSKVSKISKCLQVKQMLTKILKMMIIRQQMLIIVSKISKCLQRPPYPLLCRIIIYIII